MTLKSIFFWWLEGKLVSISLPCSNFFHDLFIKPSFAISVSVKLTVCSNTAVSESASGRGDKWHLAPLALIERCQRSVSSCCHQRLCSPQTSRSAPHHTRPRVNVLPRQSLYHISKDFYFQELIYLSEKNLGGNQCGLRFPPKPQRSGKFVSGWWRWVVKLRLLWSFSFLEPRSSSRQTSFFFHMCLHLSLPAILP